MEKYNHQKIEKKWQEKWKEEKQYEAREDSPKEKYYTLMEFPYPSGDGLHVGHVRGFTAMDIVSRKKRSEGFNVLYPIGWDAFGLPAENYAIKTGINPQIITKENIATYKKQMESLGMSFDWNREISTIEPDYYKWTQWIFLQFFKKGLAYKKKMPINWCVDCKIGLANEEVVGGVCERCGGEIEKKEKEQWMLAITKYADRLINDLKKVDYPERVKTQQINWIGRSEGATISFKLQASLEGQASVGVEEVKAFTTRPDTLFGATYLVLAPEHETISNLKSQISNLEEVEGYIKEAKAKTDIERTTEGKEKTGVEIKGIKAINPGNKEEIPIFVADYVLAHYGTGAIMAVPAHDARDFEFAEKFGLEIREVIKGGNIKKQAYLGEGEIVNSLQFNGLESEEAREKITKAVKGEKTITYKLRDWIFSRQRYWGEPIPIILCPKCGPVAVRDKDLPVELPEVEKFKPIDDGISPLEQAKDWLKVKCSECGEEARRETDVMPNWAGSSWYFLRYTDPKNDEVFASKESIKKWMPVNWYNGGMEHTTLHLLYSRFWYKFLFDEKLVPSDEPYMKRTSHGFILAEDGNKMSKSKGNVINPNEIVEKFGTDTLRIYEMFIGPFEQNVAWSANGLMGPRRFLEKIWRGFEKVVDKGDKTKTGAENLVHQTIKKVGEDIEEMKFNTAISQLMILWNEIEKKEKIEREVYKTFLRLLAPFAPHITEELWEKLGENESIHLTPWLGYDKNKVTEKKFTIVVQVDGKTRSSFETEKTEAETLKEQALSLESIEKRLKDKEIINVVYVPKKLINIVTRQSKGR